MLTPTEAQCAAAYVLWLIDNDCMHSAISELHRMAGDRATRTCAVPEMTREVQR